MIAEGQDAIEGNRIYFLDNLRTFMIFLVVLYHAGGVYESSGIWASFWLVDDPSTNNVAGIINLIIDIFVMPTIFFISGFFTPLSIRNKKGWAFPKHRFKRLIIPWVIAVLTLIPLYKIIFLYSRNLPQESWITYFHWSNGIWSQNWLWFLPVLFLFDMLYFLLSKVNLDKLNMKLAKAVGAIFLIGFLYSFCMSVFDIRGWTKTPLIDFQNERLLIYFMCFLLGALCYKLKIFDSDVTSKKLYIVICCIAWIPLDLYIIVLINFIIRPGSFIFSETIDTILLWLGFHLSLLCLLYLMITTFRYYLNRAGKILKALNENSYYVYIIHVIVLGCLALILLDTTIPSLLKYLTLAASTWVISNVIVYAFRYLFKSAIKDNNHAKNSQTNGVSS
jgi:fucose 4-O-acetylase-like acetyltransferase